MDFKFSKSRVSVHCFAY